jgi:hypothetical protein
MTDADSAALLLFELHAKAQRGAKAAKGQLEWEAKLALELESGL